MSLLDKRRARETAVTLLQWHRGMKRIYLKSKQSRSSILCHGIPSPHVAVGFSGTECESVCGCKPRREGDGGKESFY